MCWQRGLTVDSIHHAGRVGINNDRPDESLVINGNIKLSGHIIQPSDVRAKHDVKELSTCRQLENIRKLRIVQYRYNPDFAVMNGIVSSNDPEHGIADVGVIAQEVQNILPDAVKSAGNLILPNGRVIDNFLLVNKDRIFMENIGAVKGLCKVTENLEKRLKHVEDKLKLQEFYSLQRKEKKLHSTKNECLKDVKFLQMLIIFLVFLIITSLVVMAMCLAAPQTYKSFPHIGGITRTFLFEPKQSTEQIIYNYYDYYRGDEDINTLCDQLALILRSENGTNSSGDGNFEESSIFIKFKSIFFYLK